MANMKAGLAAIAAAGLLLSSAYYYADSRIGELYQADANIVMERQAANSLSDLMHFMNGDSGYGLSYYALSGYQGKYYDSRRVKGEYDWIMFKSDDGRTIEITKLPGAYVVGFVHDNRIVRLHEGCNVQVYPDPKIDAGIAGLFNGFSEGSVVNPRHLSAIADYLAGEYWLISRQAQCRGTLL